MNFREYMHIEHINSVEVEGIEKGRCHLFPKIDGTSASTWLGDNGNVCGGNRVRELSIEHHHFGFYKYIIQHKGIEQYLYEHPSHRLFGEWLILHTLDTYENNAWRHFYIFDVMVDTDEYHEYLPYEIYGPLLKEFELKYIPPWIIINNPTEQQLFDNMKRCTYLIQDGKGAGEGIVIKNYEYINPERGQVWGKIVRAEFKAANIIQFGPPLIGTKLTIEDRIIAAYCTEHFIEKTYAKLVNEKDGWSMKLIPTLFNMIYKDLTKEEIWDIVIKYKDPRIDFKVLRQLCIRKVKEVKKELFV